MADLPPDLLPLLRDLPALRGLDPNEVSAVRLDGLTNASFRLDTPRGRFVLRLPRQNPDGFAEREAEIAAARIAASLGIGPDVVEADSRTGVLVTRWVPGARTLDPEAFRREPALLERAGRTLARLHGSGRVFPRRFEVFAILARYEVLREARNAGPNPWSPRLREALRRARAALDAAPLPLIPSHCDLVPENVLDDGARLVLIDWEYAGMNDPAWDLAYLALECGLEPHQDSVLLAAYGAPNVTAARMNVHRLLAAALGALWSLLQDSAGNEGFAEWGRRRLDEAEALAGSPRLAAWLDGLQSAR